MSLLFNGRFKSTDKYINAGLFQSAYGTLWNGTFPRPDCIISIPDSRFGYVVKMDIIAPEKNRLPDGRDRNQLQWTSTNVGASLQYKDIWESYSLKLDSDWTVKETNGVWYSITSASSLNFYRPPGISGEFGLTNFNGVYPTTTLPLLNFNYRDVIGDITPEIWNVLNMKIGEWYDFLFHVKLARNNTGAFEYYIKEPGQTDYKLIASKTNTPTQMTIPDYPDDVWMSKFGLYRGVAKKDLPGATTKRTIYHSGIMVGTTKADVIDDVTCPTPQCKITITS